jgi:hypothetical protein
MPKGLRFLLEDGLEKGGKEADKIVQEISYMSKKIFGLFFPIRAIYKANVVNIPYRACLLACRH